MKQEPTVALSADPRSIDHLTGPGHPERPERFDAVLQGLDQAGLLDRLKRLPSRRATREQIELCHRPEYVDLAEREIAAGASALSCGDTDVCPASNDVALLAVGGVLEAIDAVMGNSVRRAFCANRPPGHHATPTYGMGFCIYNQIAIGARNAQARHGVERVLIADWDVHHGNGTQDIFYDDPSVFFFSTHQSPLYPGTGHAHEKGRGSGEGFTLNCPVPAGSGHAEIVGAFREHLLPAAETFRPDLVLISAGFDSRRGDPLGQLMLSDGDFTELTDIMLGIADEHAGGRLVSVLEGGYDLEGLASAATAHVTALVDHS
ncbi:MAG: histone deacetylase [Verrucomicrobia bacterium]|nr:histone deacetylase [Verrucomicrobiota bacterium]MDA1086479.1 histone deacetylase [Verrucomicrobiota bacterium]